jgi:hypothetical protein
MSICVAANVVVLLLRLFYPPWPYNTYILAAAWFAIAITLGAVVAQAVFRRGRVTYHRIIGAILLYLLIAVAFGTLFILIGLSVPGEQNHDNKAGRLFQARRYASVSRDGRKRCPRNSREDACRHG